ncbi:3'-5' exoribonuclease YhaM family protein [Thermanaerosceptrum fracticalcis]|nr:HD domain-containing protein [Thermanaerosceptrum fracticalcis]
MHEDRVFIAEMKEGSKISAPFLIKSKRLLPFKNKTGKFLNMILGDKTGQIEAFLWENAEDCLAHLGECLVAKVEGEVETYRENIQIKVNSLIPCDCYVIEELVPVSSKDIGIMQVELGDVIETINDKNLKYLLNMITNDPVRYKLFCRAPAAQFHHQAYLGGLLEHTLGVVRVCTRLADIYKDVNRDLLVTGAILHDIGKTIELSYDLMIGYTDQGRLLGHIVLGSQIVVDLIKQIPDFPKDLELKIIHMIVSHHGEYEWQSPKRPKFLEAMLLHYADMIDAKVDKFTQVKEDLGEGQVWSGWIKGLDRYVYLK